MERHHVAPIEEFLERCCAARISDRRAIGNVMEAHLHPHAFGDDRKLGADIAVAYDSQRLSPDFPRVFRRLVPDAFVKGDIVIADTPRKRDDQTHRKLTDASPIRVGRVKDRNSLLSSGAQPQIS
jgi:hypothetical protein